MCLGIGYMIDLSSATGFLSAVFYCYPALLILLGLDYILTGITQNSKALPYRRPEGWIVTVIILITIGGLAFNIIPRTLGSELKQLEQYSFAPDFWFRFNEKPIQTRRAKFRLPAGVATVRVENGFGDLQVSTGANGVVTTTTTLKPGAFWHQHDKSYLQKIRLTGAVQGGIYLIKLMPLDMNTGFLPHVTAGITLEIPKGIGLELKNASGEVKVTEVYGNLNVENNNGRVEIHKVTGDVIVTNRLSEIFIGEVSGNVNVTVSAGQIKIDRVGKNLTARTDFGNLNVGEVSGDLNAVGKSGGIEVAKVSGKTRVENTFGGVHLKECNGPVTADINTGDLTVTVARVMSPLNFNVQFGSIQLSLPENAGFTLDANTSFGDIASEFNIIRHKKTTGESAVGAVNGSGPLVKINVQNGSIRLKKRL
jgi:hypothetical protein